jgi:hypothetical protein
VIQLSAVTTRRVIRAIRRITRSRFDSVEVVVCLGSGCTVGMIISCSPLTRLQSFLSTPGFSIAARFLRLHITSRHRSALRFDCCYTRREGAMNCWMWRLGQNDVEGAVCTAAKLSLPRMPRCRLGPNPPSETWPVMPRIVGRHLTRTRLLSCDTATRH